MCVVINLFMNHAVFQFGELAAVPAVGGTHQVAGDALDGLEARAALRTASLVFLRVLVATVGTVVAVVVHRSVTDIVLVHHVHDLHYRLLVVGGVTVNLNVENVSAKRQLVIRALDLGLVARRAVIVHGHVVGVGVVILVRHAGNHAECLAVLLGEAARKSLGGRGQYGIVVAVVFRVGVHFLTHVAYDAQAELLSLVALAVMLACQGYQTLGQADESDAERTLVDDTLDAVVGFQALGVVPQHTHQQRELLGEGGLLELEALVKLTRRQVHHLVQTLEEFGDTLLLVLDTHLFDGDAHNVDGCERQVAAAYGCLFAETVLEHTGAASQLGKKRRADTLHANLYRS